MRNINHRYPYDGVYTFEFSRYVDEFGNPVERTRDKFPYSYDGYVQWRGGDNKECTGTVYSDRLFQWDYEKARNLVDKHFDGRANWNNPVAVEAYLRDYFNSPKLKLILIMEYCNVASGYPVWRFDYKGEVK